MATEADIPESKSIPQKIECEDEDQKSRQLDRTVDESFLEELNKVDDGHEKLPRIVENSANADTTKETAVGTITVDTVFTGDVGTLQGESFLKSPSVAKVAYEETCSISEQDQTDKILKQAEKENSEDRNQPQKDQENETGSGENEGMEKTKEIAENGNDSLNALGKISLQQTETEQPALKLGGQSSEEERNIDQHVQIVDRQKAFVEENPESMTGAICGPEEDKSGETEPEKDTEPESTKRNSDIAETTLSQNKEALYHTLDSAEDSLDKEVETVTEACEREVSINKNFSAKTSLNEEELEEKNLKAEENEPEKPYNTTGNEKCPEAVEASENEGEEKREAEHISCDEITDDSISIPKQNPDIENDETMLEIGEGAKEDKSGETEPEKDVEPESTKKNSDIALSQNKEALYHTLDSAEDSLDKEVETVTEACDREVSINKNFSAKTPLIEEELEEKNLKAEEKEPEKPFNTMGNEKGSEAVGACENEGEEKREAEDISCDEFRDDSISILKQNPDIENDETMLEIGEGAKDMVDGPPLTLVHPIEDKIEDKNNLDIPFVRQTEEICCQKVENPVIFAGEVKKSPPEDHQAEILEKYAQATAYGNGKDDEVDEQKEVIPSLIQVQAMIEASAGEKRIEEKFTVQPEKNICNTESADDEEHLKEDKSKHEECPEQTFLQRNETSEIKETDASSESVGTITCVQDEISMKILEESFDKERKEDKPTDIVEISEHGVPKEKNFPLLDLNEVIERAEVEIQKEDEIDLHVTHSFLEDTNQMDGEMLDEQKVEETIIGSTEITTLEHTFTGGEQLQEAISITNSIEAGKLENKLDYDNKTEVEDVKEKIDEELQKNEETFDKETHEIATKCDDTEAGCIAEDAPVKVHSTKGAGEEPSDQSSSELRSKDYSYRSEDDTKSNINKAEEAYDGPRIPAPQDVTEEQIIEGNIRYLSPESIEETAKNFHDDGDEEEISKEGDSKDHIIKEGNYIDQLPDSLAESQDFQDDEKEAEQSKGEIFEESETAQASKSLIHETNQDDESPKFFYHGAPFTQQEEREQGEVKEPSVMVAVPNLEENLEKEVKEAEKDANETGIEKEEDIELLPEASEPRERTESKESTDLILNSKESETNVEKLKMGYKLEPEEEAESKDSKEIIEEVLVNEDPVIASTDQDSEKHIIQEESTVVDISPKVIGEETSKSSTEDGKADEHNEEVCEIIQTVVESDEDTQKQIIGENSVTKDNSKVFQTITAGEDTREQIREEIENFKYQSPKSIEEETLKESYKEDEVCEEFMIPVSSTHKENEHATPDLSSLPVVEKVVNESSKECETKGIELKEEVEDPNLEFKEQIEATDSTEELKLETLRDRAATLDTETLPKESNENLVEGFLLSNVSEWENNKDTLEKEDPTMNDSETASAAVTTVLECSKETEPEGDKQVEESDLTSKEKGLATTETKDAMPGSEYINVKPQETSNLEVISDTEILTVVNKAGEKVEYAMPETESKDQTETPEKLSFQTEDEPTCLTDDSELASLEVGIKSANDEVAKQSHEELSVPPEISNVKYISGSEDVEFLKEEVASEIANQNDISKSEILKDNDSSKVVDREAKSENEKPLNEASKCIEALGTFTNSEKTMEQEDLAEKFEANLKDVEEEKRVVELEEEIRSQESGPSDTEDTCTHKEENLESADPGKELECASESVPENSRNKTLTETSDTQINENNSIQYQNTESVEQQNTEPEVQKCEKEMDEEVELKGDNEDNIKGPQSADETRSDVILTKEILMVSEQVDEKDSITEHIIQEERDTTEHHSASAGEERVHEVENCDPASDSIVHMKTVNLENEKLREGDASPLTIASNEAAMERQGDENPEDVSIRVAEVSEENAKEGIIEQEDNCSDKLDIASATVVKEEKNLGEPQPDDKPGEGFNNVAEDRSLQPIVKSETSSDGEGVDSLKFEETLNSISKVPIIQCEDVDKENVIVEKQIANEIEETKNASHAIFEIKDQSDNDIDKTGGSLDVEEPNAEEIENEKHEHVIMNIIEKGEEENINSEDTFGTETVEETYLQNEEPRELDFSKPIEGIQKDSQNEPLKEEGHTSTEEKLKSQEDVSEMSNVDSPSNEENSELIRPTEYSSLGGSKEERILDLGGSNKNDDCSTTTRSLGEGILPEVGEECKETSYPQCHEALADSEETQIKELHLEAPVVELRSEENEFEGNADINNEISNEEISKVAEKVDEKENILEKIIHEERGKMEHNSVFAEDEAIEEVENCDPVSAKNLKSTDSVVQLETLNLEIEEQPTRVGDVSPITKGLNEAQVEIQDNEKAMDFSISASEVSKENAEEGIIEQGTNCSDKLDLASVTVIAEEKRLVEPQLDSKHGEGFNNVTEDISLRPIVITETSQEGEGADNLKFEKTSHLISKIPTMECEDEDKENTTVEKQVTYDIEDTRNAFHAVSEVKNQSVKEVDETWESLSVEEPDAGEFNEEIKHEHVTMNTIENIEDGKINIGGFIGTKTTEETLPNEEPMELEVSEPIKGIQNDGQNEQLKEESGTSAEDLKVRPQEDVSEMSDVDYLSSEKNNERTRPAEYSSQEAPKDKEILDLGGSNKNDDCSTTTRSLGEGILPEVGEECKETSYPQCHEALADSEETQMKEAHLEAPVVELRSEENQFEGNDDIKNEISNEEITKIKEADNESHQVSVSEDTIKEIHQEDELMDEESPREKTKEAVTTAQNNTQDEEVSEEIQKASTSMNIITQITHEDRAAKDHDLVFVGHDNESLPEETEGKNFKEATTKLDLENEFDSRNFKDWIEAINLREQATPDSELDLNTADTNYTKESAITQKEEEPNTNLDVPLGTGPATEGSVHVNEDEKIEEASETHPRELVHEIEKDIVVPVADNQESLMEYEKHTHTPLESASDGLEIKEDLKVNGEEASPETGTSSVDGNCQEVSLETGTSFVDGNPKEEIPDDDRKIREDEKKHNLATDKHIAVEMSTAAEKTVINDEREHTEYKEPLDDSTRERAEIDNRICKNEDKETQDQTEKPDKFINIHDLDIEMLQRGSTADLSGANETTQNIQRLEKTSDYTSEKQIPRERDPNESKETVVASGDKDVQPVVEDPFAKNLQKTEVEDLKPKTTTTVESEQEVVKSDEGSKNFKDWIEAINLREQETPDSEFDLDTAGTNYNKENAITQMEEEPNTNLGVPLATGPTTKVAVHVNEDEKFEEASESHPKELGHETEKDIAVAVADNQESLMEHETSLESASDGLEVKEDLKLNGQEVSPDTGTSSVDGNTQEEILDDDRKIRENEKQYKLATDKHVGVEMSIAAERTTINDEREHTEYKESLEDSTRGSDRKLDEAGIDSILCQNEDREPQDQTEKSDEFININDLDIAMLRRGSNTDLSEVNETIQNIQKLEKASDSTSEKQIPREIDPNEKKETLVASGDKDVEPVLEDSFAKTLQKPEVDDLKPETTAIVDPEHIGVVCDEEKRTDDAGEENISLSHPLQKSTRETLPMAGHVSEEKEPTLAKEEMQAEKAEGTLQEEAKTDEEKYEEEEGDEHKKEDSGSDAPVMVEASRDMDTKVSPKKHHGILSGVGSKVKHSISKVKKAIIGKSSHSKPISPK